MAGDGLLAGTWIPLSMIGYAVGAKFGLTKPNRNASLHPELSARALVR